MKNKAANYGNYRPNYVEQICDFMAYLNQLDHPTLTEVLDYVSETSIKITKSKFGYIYFYDEVTMVLTNYAWSKDVMPTCKIMNPQTSYDLQKTGLWGEAIRQRKPIITNHYESDNPFKKGFPEGHVAITRHMNVPLIVDKRIVALIGVANKETNYNNTDVKFLTLLINECWNKVAFSEIEKKLLENEKRYRGLFEMTTDGVALHELLYNEKGTPIDYKIIDSNQAFTVHTGIPHQDAIGKGAAVLYGTSKPPFFNNFKTVVETGEPTQFDVYFEPMGKHFNISAFSPHKGQFATIFRDITQQRKVDMELRENRERLNTVLQNTDAIIFQLDQDGIFMLSEGKALKKVGLEPGQAVGMSAYEMYNQFPEIIDSIKRAMAGKIVNTEITLGDTVFQTIYTPVNNINGELSGIIGLSVDITERKQIEKNLYTEKERLRITLQSIGDGVIATDNSGHITVMNGVAEQLTGWKFEEAAGRRLSKVFDIYNEINGKKCENPIEKVLRYGTTIELANHTALRSTDGSIRSIADSAAPIMDSGNNIIGVVLVFRDVTEAKKKEKDIIYLSYHDALTGIYNRAFFEEELKRLDTKRQLPISIIMGDVNGLKLTNDVFGHVAGDKILVSIANILRDCCRAEDIVARWGGDEFCILLPNTSANDTQDICKRIYQICQKPEIISGEGPTHLSISLGFATKLNIEEDILKVLKFAEDAMYKRKLLEGKSLHSSIISSMKTTLFEKSCETKEHANRIVQFSRAVGLALNLLDEQLNDLELFSILHDIGKIGINDHIITKPGKLTDEEWGEMKRHSEIGYRIAQASQELVHIGKYILSHHERWDGQGYPRGLSEKNIPLLARIVAVVDAYDAMTNDRVYRKAMSEAEAKAELKNNAGTQFDPEIVQVFLETLNI